MGEVPLYPAPIRTDWCEPRFSHVHQNGINVRLGGGHIPRTSSRQPGKGNSNSHGARPVHQIISKIKLIWTGRLSIKKSLSSGRSTLPCSGLFRRIVCAGACKKRGNRQSVEWFVVDHILPCRGTSLIRNCLLLGPYLRPRALRWS